MSSGKLIIKSEEKTPIKVHFDLAERKEVVYSFAETFKTLLEDIDGCFRIGFPNTDYRIYWTDMYEVDIFIRGRYNALNFTIFYF